MSHNNKRTQSFLPIGGMVALCAVVIGLAGCATQSRPDAAYQQTGESLVLIGQQPKHLAFAPALDHPLVVRSTYRAGLTNTVQYEAGRDYVLTSDGAIQRTADSRILDFSTNILFGKEDFDHNQFPGFGNLPFFVYVDYHHRERWTPPVAQPEFSAVALPETRRKLRAGDPVRIVTFGDSITAGGDASTPDMIFWARWADALRKKYPRASIEAINGATGGDTTAQGLQRLQAKVLDQQPDLVLIGFGMNDHNRPGFGVALPAFADNLRQMINRIRVNTKAEIVLFSAFPPNPQWRYGSHNMEAYAVATEAVAREKQCAFADVYQRWQQLATRKAPEDMLANDINHPNDFGHNLYFEALQALGL